MSFLDANGLNYYHEKLMTKLSDDYDADRKLRYRLPSTQYSVDDTRLLIEDYHNFYLKCTVAGTTASTDLTKLPDGVEVNDEFTDGTVTWIVMGIASTSGAKVSLYDKTSGTYVPYDPDNVSSSTSIELMNARKISTEYEIGDIASSPLIPSWAILKCTTAGTTSSDDLVVPADVKLGTTITDGSVTWSVAKVVITTGSTEEYDSKTTAFNDDGSITETSTLNGVTTTKITTFNDTVIKEVTTSGSTTSTKITTFNDDGSISEVIK